LVRSANAVFQVAGNKQLSCIWWRLTHGHTHVPFANVGERW
jgi:hypothetical protein